MSLAAHGTIREAMEAIERGEMGFALLLEEGSGRFGGLVTDGDIRRALLAGLGLETLVASVPRPTPTVGRVEMSPEEVNELFDDQIRAVPLLDDLGKVADLAVVDRRMRLPISEPHMGEAELRYVTECVLTGWISSAGKFVERFEHMFAELCGTREAISTSNGTTALHLALLAMDVGSGDEVIVPSLTFIAPANAVRYTGAVPVFVDSDRETWNIDPSAVENAITARTKAIIPVHLYGHPADMDPIMRIAERHGLMVIEDAAEAHGARYKGRPVGGIGHIGIFSFYGNKILTTGEGGMVTTDRIALAERIRLLRDHGMSKEKRYWHPVLGYNYRLTNLQAAIGVAQLEKVDTILEMKRRITQRYRDRLRGIDGIELPPNAPWADNVHWLFSVLVDAARFGHTRDQVIAHLSVNGIETRTLFPPVHTQPIYDTGADLPVAQDLAARGVSLPSAISLRMEDVDRVAYALSKLRAHPAT